jgi:UDP-sugar transporter A1/2/3
MWGSSIFGNLSPSAFRLILLQLMVLQNSSTVLVGRYSRASVPPAELYVVNHLILVTELAKLVISCCLEHNASNGRLVRSLQLHVIGAPLDCLKIILPSLLYLVQNSLLYVALSNLSAPLFQVTYQAKLLTTALVSVLLLQRRYSTKQWICLAVLGIGVAVVVLAESEKDGGSNTSTTHEQSLFVGLVSVSIACLSSALAGVYIEMVLKNVTPTKSDAGDSAGEAVEVAPPSLWMRNIQMAFFSVCIAILQGFSLSAKDKAKPFLHGFSIWVWMLVILQAGGGLLVAAVIKYADNVLKGLATGVSVVLATICSMFLFHTPLTVQFSLGASLILASVYWFSNDLPSSLVRFIFFSTASTPAAKVSSILESRMPHSSEKKDDDYENQINGDIEMQKSDQTKPLLQGGMLVRPKSWSTVNQ